MPTLIFRLTAVTSADRNEIISEVSSIIEAVGGWIDDVHFFSNISVALHFVIPSSARPALVQRLEAQPLRMDAKGRNELMSLTMGVPSEEVTCSLQITFFHAEPDLRQHIPKVPG